MFRARGCWRTGRVAVVVALALSGIGCASQGASSEQDIVCNAPGVSADTIKIGYIYPETGLTAELFRSSRSGVTARIAEANANGGIHGRRIEFEWRDDASDPATNARAARELVERENVFGIIETTTVASGSAEYLHQNNVPVAGNALESVWSQYRNMFTYANRFTTGGTISSWGQFARERGATRAVVLVASVSESSRSSANALTQSLEAAGIEVVETIDYAPGVSSPDSIGRRIRSLNVDMLTGGLAATDFAAVQTAAIANGAKFKVVMSPSGYDRRLLQAYGARLANTYYFMNYRAFEENLPGHQRYRAAIAQYSPELTQPDQELAFTGYINTDLFLLGLERAGECPTREGFINALRQVRDYDAGGLLPGPADLSVLGQLNVCYTFVQVNEDGTGYNVVEGANPLCGERIGGPSLS